MARLLHALAMVAALAAPASASSYTNDFDIEFYDNADDVWLISDVEVGWGRASLKYSLRYQLLDIGLDVVWTDHHGAVLLHGGNGFGFNNVGYSLDTEWVGLLLPTPSSKLLGGKADFSGGQVQVHPCPAGKVCPTSHYDWADNARAGGAGARAGASFAAVDETRATLSTRVRSTDDPDNPDADIETPLYLVTSRAEALGGLWRYHYAVSNLGAHDVQFELAGLGLAGTLAAATSFEAVVDSAAAPGYLRTTPKLIDANGVLVEMRFDALVPVPEPASASLLAAGLLGLAARAARRRPDAG